MSVKVLPIAFYLPQYHPIPENDKWWGKGFTEWTNVTKAKPLFHGHRQPRFPADLGYYDLRVTEVREQQAELAKAYGIYGFAYYHYWFGHGRQLLQRPIADMLRTGKPDMPFCICWANQTWSGIWHGAPKQILIKQEYPGKKDNEKHFAYLFKAFEDPRYIEIDGKPLFMVYDVNDLPNPKEFADDIKTAAHKAGFKGVYLMASNITSDDWDLKENGFDAKVCNAYNKAFNELSQHQSNLEVVKMGVLFKLLRKEQIRLRIIDHCKLFEKTEFKQLNNGHAYPMVVPNWDNTPRSGIWGVVLKNSSPDLLRQQISKSIDFLKRNNVPEKLLFVKSWNEWAEGNYLEPDTVDGYKYLDVFKSFEN